MLAGKKVVVVMPAYNAAMTLRKTYQELPRDVVDQVIVTDDASRDETIAVARDLGLRTIVHERNRGYGANQKTCYRAALGAGADIVVMIHPDYQYSPRLTAAMASMIASGHYDLVLGSRILTGTAREGGMPLYKYVSNRVLTALQNVVCGAKLSEYHTGFRAYSRQLLTSIPFEANSDGFVFDNELIIQALYFGFAIGEISCPTRYFTDASSIGFGRSLVYGGGVLATMARYRLARADLAHFAIFDQPKDAAAAQGGDDR